MVKAFFTSALFAATALAASRMSAPPGAIVVAKSGGDYDTVNAAMSSLNTTQTTTQIVFIEEGTYDEQVYIPELAGRLIVYGQTEDDTTYTNNLVNITHDIKLADVKNDDMTGTLRNHAPYSAVYNLNVANTAGQAGHQALALSAYGTQQGYYACQFTGYQDTLLAQSGQQIYANCLIQGAVDFIFGQHARAWFHQCDLRVVERDSAAHITANGRPSESDDSFYVIHKSDIAAADGHNVPKGTYYLGRPWSQYARVVFQKTTMSNVINSAGWAEWSDALANTENVTFAEYGNSGAGAHGVRALFSALNDKAIPISTILGSKWNHWVDITFVN
ncbi:pectin lyase fold/virulence factor [Aspergillus avenaceus]|uniref:Pectinesterase n=1 Tax=Aspergillus avenaceus TaxID=36643 RepID=A0A5N6TS27_ASPAV|nr:pectin lyase fold/virulence factor [Aspergillus avenaceus]